MMEDFEIINRLELALDRFTRQDSWLSSHNLSERSMAHRIGFHLNSLFPTYNVDCEYNGDVDQGDNRKVIRILESNLQRYNLDRENEAPNEDDLISRSVYPDIVIHQRGNNHYNLCVIEIKKSSSNVRSDYDKLKLECYTSNNHGNSLVYQIGVFIKINVNTDSPSFEFDYYKDEIRIDKPTE